MALIGLEGLGGRKVCVITREGRVPASGSQRERGELSHHDPLMSLGVWEAGPSDWPPPPIPGDPTFTPSRRPSRALKQDLTSLGPA